MVTNWLRRLWNITVHPTSRLNTDFPWTAGKMAKTYGIAVCYYIAGSFAPVIAFFGVLWFSVHYYPALAYPLLDNDHWLVLVAGITIVSFFTGFGSEMMYFRRAMHKDGLSLRRTLSLNLDSLHGSLWAAFWRALVAFGIGYLLNELYSFLPIPPAHDPAAAFTLTLGTGSFLGMTMLMVFAAPFFEELVFRGFLYNMLRTGFHKRTAGLLYKHPWLCDALAAALSGAVFAAAHLNISGFPLYLALGVISAELYRRSGSLIPSMMLHAMNNLAGVIALIMLRGHI